MAFWNEDTLENRKKNIQKADDALRQYKEGKVLKAKIKNKKPDYAYKKYYA